ncbi:MAG: hypothetical protein JSU92_14810 [Deltaproteobacteria bacterium]|nr:MAG: hypothetical protein JSU92_14810 [Deltaproteobacteria bacterium]
MKEIYVFGAGASYASGRTPLGDELGWSYFFDANSLYRMENGRPAIDDIEEKNIEFITFKKFLNLAKNIYPELREDEKFERALSRGEQYIPYNLDKRYYMDEMLRILYEKKDGESAKLIKQLVYEHIVESSFDSRNLLYNNFLNLISKYKVRKDITIISLNYDTLLREYFDNGIDKGIYIDYLVNFDCFCRKEYKYGNNIVPVIKLRGSLDWGICNECNNLSLFHWHLRRYSYDDRKCKYCNYALEPFIILPHEEVNKKIEVLWKKAARDLRIAKKITIIGYSFPPYDKKVIELFANSMNSDVDLEVVDNEDMNERIQIRRNEIQRNYKKMFPHLNKNIKVNLGGFEKYISDLEKKE